MELCDGLNSVRIQRLHSIGVLSVRTMAGSVGWTRGVFQNYS